MGTTLAMIPVRIPQTTHLQSFKPAQSLSTLRLPVVKAFKRRSANMKGRASHL